MADNSAIICPDAVSLDFLREVERAKVLANEAAENPGDWDIYGFGDMSMLADPDD